MTVHANATTTPKMRAYIQTSDKSVVELAAELGVSQTTIRRWRARKTVNDGSHAPKRSTLSLSETEERLICELRTRAKLSLDDITDVMRRCVNAMLSRSAVYRCLQRHGLARRPMFDKQAVGTVPTRPRCKATKDHPERNTRPVNDLSSSVAERQGRGERGQMSMGGLGRYALALWLLGAVVYGASTQAFVFARDVFGQKPETVEASAKKPAAVKPAISSWKNGTADRAARVDAPTASVANLDPAPHAVLAAQPVAVSPAMNANAPAPARREAAADADGEWVEVSGSGVNMRAGPSSATRVMTVQSLGTKLRVVSHDNGWTEVVDPDTGQKGWIYRKYAKPTEPSLGDERTEAARPLARARGNRHDSEPADSEP